MTADPLLALVGPTATGKTEAAVALALRLEAEIVSVDSMLVYRGMDVGTAKPTPEQRARVPHHVIDVADPSEPFSVGRYQALALAAIGEIRARGHRVLLVGGSGLYFRAVVDRLELPGTDPRIRRDLESEAEAVGALRLYERLAATDPTAAAKIEPSNIRRTVRALEVAAVTGEPFSAFARCWGRYDPAVVRAAGVTAPRDVLDRRIRARLRSMLERGMLDEVRTLVERGFGAWLTATQAIGYAELARHLRGGVSLDEAIVVTVRRTRALARRQLAWFRRDPRVRWIETGEGGAIDAADRIVEHLS